MRMHLTCLIKTVTAEGQPMYTYKPLKTDIEKLPMFVAGLKLKHRLDDNSPIRDFRSVQHARDMGVLAFYALIEGTEEVYGKPIFARHAYKADTVMFGYHFGQMLIQNDKGGASICAHTGAHGTIAPASHLSAPRAYGTATHYSPILHVSLTC